MALTTGTMSDNWLAGFHDDQLSALVADAILHNTDLRVGAARVEQALLYAKLAGAGLLPVRRPASPRAAARCPATAPASQGAVLNASWELDLWGRVRYGRAAARADALAAAADFEYARQSIAALVARSWFLAIEAGLQAEIARGALRDNQALVRLAEDRARIGVGNEEDVFVARSSLGTYEDALRQIELSREQAIRALEILAGRYPAAALTLAATLPTAPETMPAGLPSELLERRPDVIAAERRVAAAFNRIGEAKAARLPRISLTAGVSSISSELLVLKEQDNPIWNFGAGLVAPIYKGGALKTQVEIRTVEQKQAIAAYAGVGLRAFGEVENALSAELAARDRERILARTLSDSQRALEIVQRQFQVGSTDLRFVTQRQLALNSTQSALIRAQSEQRVQRVNLHLALGGSFEDRSQPAGARRRPPPLRRRPMAPVPPGADPASGLFAHDLRDLDALVAVVVDDHAILTGLDLGGRRHRARAVPLLVDLHLDHADLVAGARLRVRRAAAEEIHRLIGDQHDLASAGRRLGARPPDRPRLVGPVTVPTFRAFRSAARNAGYPPNFKPFSTGSRSRSDE